MSPALNPFDLYRLLPKSNCRDCALPTCMAFAAALIRGEKRVADCPHVDGDAARGIGDILRAGNPVWQGQKEELDLLRQKVAALDFPATARRLGVVLDGGRLTVKSLGKDFLVDSRGGIASDCHTHPGLAIPLLRYVLASRGGEPTGRWLPYRELAGAAGRGALFEQMCERPLKRLIDGDTELLRDLIDIFSGERSVNLFGADISLVLYPLPKLPVLICCWEPDEGLESSLHVFFDETAVDHLSADWIHGLCVGLVEMFGRIVLRHS